MFLSNIKLVNFRNYDQINLDLNPGINIIYGENAQGKTNLLESIYFLALTKSHRSLNDINLIKNDCEYSKLITHCKLNNLDTKFEINIDKKRKKCFIDDKLKSINDYVSKLKVIIFFPEDLDLIKSSPDIRRRYINTQISQLDKNYFKILSDYNKLLKIRNELLKNYLKNNLLDKSYFDIITNYLIDKASYIYLIRKRYINKINDYAEKIFYNLSGYKYFKLVYKNNFIVDLSNVEKIKKSLTNKFDQLYEVEKKTGLTMVGPHRDDIEFILDHNDMRIYSSQGQQRMAVLALKLSEIEIFKKYNEDSPILLLDDVFSELDENKKNNLLKYIDNKIQTIITTTDLSNLDNKILNNSKLINIEDGKIIN